MEEKIKTGNYNIRISVGEIDYRASFAALLPCVLEKCREIETPNLLLRLLMYLDDDAAAVLEGFMGQLSRKAMNEIFCWCVNTWQDRLQNILNGYMAENEVARNITIGTVCMEAADDGIALSAIATAVDYRQILENSGVRTKINDIAVKATEKNELNMMGRLKKVFAPYAGDAVKIAHDIMPKMTENQVLKWMQRGDVSQKIMKMLEQALIEKGIRLKLQEIVISRKETKNIGDKADIDTKIIETAADTGITADTGTHLFSSETENEIIWALAAHLRNEKNKKNL